MDIETDGVRLENLKLTKSAFQSGLLIRYGNGGFYIDVKRQNKKNFLEGCWIPDFDASWGGGSFNYNRWNEALQRRERLPAEAAKVLEPIVGERNFVSRPETLAKLIKQIGEDKVEKAVYDVIKCE